MDRRLQYAFVMTQSTDQPDLLERYTIDRKLSQGGMAEVYLAHCIDADRVRPVVIKGVLPGFVDNDDFVRMMRNEARIAQSLCHPNIVRVEDVVEAEGRPFIVMEYLEGRNLHEIVHRATVRGQKLSRAFVCEVVVKMLAALGHAHERADDEGRLLGLVHRDVSLANVIVTWSGRVTVIDFGVAKATSLDDQGLTRVGQLKGKTTYMSPEQVQRDPLDCRSDLFSVGIVLWEMLTQRRLFARKQWMESMTAICLVDAPPPSTYLSDLPPALDRICARALSRDRQARYQTAAEMRVELEALIAAEGWSASPKQLKAELVTLFPDEAPPLDDGDETAEAEIVLEAEMVLEAEPEMPALYEDDGEAETRVTPYVMPLSNSQKTLLTTRSPDLHMFTQRHHGPSVYDDWGTPPPRESSWREGRPSIVLMVMAALLFVAFGVALSHLVGMAR
jgi:eukaryotic-like serine/threonine-protein kinase